MADSGAITRQFLEDLLAGHIEHVLAVIDDDLAWNPAESHPIPRAQYKGHPALMNDIASRRSREI
jgi:hypothetical protein